MVANGRGVRCSFLIGIQESAASSLVLLSLVSRLIRWRIGGSSFLQNRIRGYLNPCPLLVMLSLDTSTEYGPLP